MKFPFKILKKIYERYSDKIYLFLGKKAIISSFQYGRLGNNIQQLMILIAHYKVFKCKFFFRDNFESIYKLNINFEKLPGYINPLKNKAHFDKNRIIKSEMFLFTRKNNKFFRNSFLFNRFLRHSFISKKRFFNLIPEILDELHPIFKNYTDPKRITTIEIKELNNNCVLHLRGGDTIPPQNLNHVSNPLRYYYWLRNFHKSIIIVQEPLSSSFKNCDASKQGVVNPILPKLYDIFEIKKIISGKLEDDFAIIANSRNVSTSGVGTFPIAACLLNKKLKNFYYSDAYLNDHLNPEFIREDINKYCYKIGEDFFKRWQSLSPEQRIKFSLNF